VLTQRPHVYEYILKLYWATHARMGSPSSTAPLPPYAGRTPLRTGSSFYKTLGSSSCNIYM